MYTGVGVKKGLLKKRFLEIARCSLVGSKYSVLIGCLPGQWEKKRDEEKDGGHVKTKTSPELSNLTLKTENERLILEWRNLFYSSPGKENVFECDVWVSRSEKDDIEPPRWVKTSIEPIFTGLDANEANKERHFWKKFAV